jgi:hypothetical protein
VSSFPAELQGRVAVRTVSHLTPEAKRVVQQMGWSNHGLVIRRDGEVLYSARDHRANAYDALVALKTALDQPLECQE